jgi:hypothetical protein
VSHLSFQTTVTDPICCCGFSKVQGSKHKSVSTHRRVQLLKKPKKIVGLVLRTSYIAYSLVEACQRSARFKMRLSQTAFRLDLTVVYARI